MEMALFVVDEDKCKRDGICVAECPIKIIALKDDDNVPRPARGAEEMCINCGHCVAVCPHGALSLEKMPVDSCPPVKEEWLTGPGQAEHFLRSRRSIRSYKKKPVDKETLVRLIEIARYAPTGHNFQPVNWVVIYGREELDRLIGIVIDWMRDSIEKQPELAKMMHLNELVAAWDLGVNVISRGAPHLIFTHAPQMDPSAQSACRNALSYLELAALPLGLGSCCCGYFDAAATFWRPLREALELPKKHICFGSVMVGYPQYKYHRLPLRKEPRITWRGV
jgi:nitroreductase/NAD-dependent dihydropyrimidine dehydrogenase PreA subunit